MWKLTIEDDEGATRELDLVRDGYTIGRGGTCDVFLPERNVSRRHARLERDADGRWWFVDLGAPYGSFVNGHRIANRTEVSRGDVLQVGDHWLGLVSDAPEADGVRVDDASPRPSTPWDVRAEPDRLIVFSGPDQGRRLRLDAGPVLIGAGEGVTIRLPDGAAPEGVHALIRPLPQGHYELVRRTASIALRVRLHVAERALLHDGDLVHFELPDETELMTMRFLAASRVRRSTATPFAASGEGASIRRGHRLDPMTLPTFESIKESLRDLPLGWRLEGEGLWPLPQGYCATPPRFTDMTTEPPLVVAAPVAPAAAETALPAPQVEGTAPAPKPRSRTGRWAAMAALLALFGGAWALGFRTHGPGEVRGDAGRSAGAPSEALAAAVPPAAGQGDAGGSAQAAATDEPSPPAVASAAPIPAPNRPNTSAARAPSPPLTPARHLGSAPAGRSFDGASERLRETCRAYAERIARRSASPDIVQFYRARCP
ncbi:MAG: FHA domain-containing protein [Polyangiaceae bacterium]|jgi:hypothetical protein|nr:FHA domain-containing protein [Polyangiaceae bacterium]